MILLSKKINENEYFDFDKILIEGYHIKEDKDRIIQKFVNGRRKEILSSYVDCIIKVDLGTFDLATTIEYLDELESGTYKYYSLEDHQYKEAYFLIEEKPELTIESSIGNDATISDFNITLLRAGD